MKVYSIENLRTKFLRALNSITSLINQVPEKLMKKRTFFLPEWTSLQNIGPKIRKSDKKKKEHYTHKGPSYKAKGKVNSDAVIFNHPRKDVPPGQGRPH